MSDSQTGPISWADLKDSVPKLTGAKDFNKWRPAIEAYAYGKGIRAHLVKDTVEPYRACKPNGSYDRGDDSLAGDEPPAGTQIDDATILANNPDTSLKTISAARRTATRLTPDQDTIWRRWARNERAARTILLNAVDDDLTADLLDLETAHAIYKSLCARYGIVSKERVTNLLRDVLMLRVTSTTPSADELDEFFRSATRLYAELSRTGKKIEDDEKVANTLGSLPPSVSTLLRIEWTADSLKTWSSFTATFTRYTEAIRATTATATGPAGLLNATASTKKNNKNSGGQGKAKDNKDDDNASTTTSRKRCEFHPRN